MITDELRDWAKQNQSHSEMFGGLPPKHPFNRCCKVEDLLAIADRIDAEHETQVADAFETRNSDENLESDGWVRLPVDADGVPIRVGDVMWQKDRITKRACKAIMGGEYVMLDGIQGAVYAKGLTHYHAPTTEDVLLEACKAYHGLMVEGMSDLAHDMPAPSEVIAEYAKRLQLREVDE